MRSIYQYLPNQTVNILAGVLAVSALLLFAYGYIPLSGIAILDYIPLSLECIANPMDQAFFLAEKSIIAFTLAFAGTAIFSKLGALLNVDVQKKLYFSEKSQEEISHIKERNCHLEGKLEVYESTFKQGLNSPLFFSSKDEFNTQIPQKRKKNVAKR